MPHTSISNGTHSMIPQMILQRLDDGLIDMCGMTHLYDAFMCVL